MKKCNFFRNSVFNNKKYNQKLYSFLGFTKRDGNLVNLSNISASRFRSHGQSDWEVKILDSFNKFPSFLVNHNENDEASMSEMVTLLHLKFICPKSV